MSRDSVRYGRVPKRSRERNVGSASVDDSARVTTTAEADDAAEVRQNALKEVVLSILNAHQSHCGYTEDAMQIQCAKPLASHLTNLHNNHHQQDGLQDAAILAEDEQATSTFETQEEQKVWLWQQFAHLLTSNVQRVVEFAKRVPGFYDLGQDDQLILIKTGFFEIWLTYVAKYTNETSLMLDDGSTITRQQLETMYDSDFVASLCHFTNNFNALGLGDTEIALFTAIILLTPDRPGITDFKAIEQSKNQVLAALKLQLNRNSLSVDQVTNSLVARQLELKTLGAKHSNHLELFRINWKKMKLPPLFAEIYDIPKDDPMEE